jgi:LysR family transcriptional regulator, transcriptional activator of nhaA
MEWLNYHHLLYFWTVVKEGGLTRAAHKLNLAPSTVSGQLHEFQSSLGEELFIRRGRKLEMTEMGRTVFQYADEIFRLGHEMIDTVHDRPTGKPLIFTVGIVDVISKQIVKKILEPVQNLKIDVRLICREGQPERLLPDLVIHALDMLLVDAPVSPSAGFRVFNHLLVESGTSLLATPQMIKRYKSRLPRSLDGAPFLLATGNTTQRRVLDEWFGEQQIRPNVRAEFEDGALLAAFGQDGLGILGIPTFIEKIICKQLGLKVLLNLPQIRERFYAVTAERRVSHPAVMAIFEVFHKTQQVI